MHTLLASIMARVRDVIERDSFVAPSRCVDSTRLTGADDSHTLHIS